MNWNDSSKITVLGVKGNRVRVGIEAPKTIPVIREELLSRDQNQTAIPAA